MSMSKLLALAAAATLLSVTACKSINEPASQPAAAQPAPEANVAPKAAEPAAPSPTEATPVTAAKPVETAPAATAAKPASEAAPAATAAVQPATVPPAAAPESPAAAAAKPSVLTKDQALALAKKGNCLTCHKIESRVVGPAWKDVAAKYKADANAVSTITSHIKSGGSFGWKFGVMPPRGGSSISDADVANLAKFIASLK